MTKKGGTRGDIDTLRNALRPRMARVQGGTTAPPLTIPPHTHHATQIIAEPEPTTALLAGDDVQEDLEELGVEKLARSGEQPMLGDLDMNHHSVANVDDLEVESDVTMTGPVGQAVVNGPRAIHLAGDDDDSEARIDGAERIVFNNEPTKSVLDNPSRLDMNVAVEAGVDYTAAEGRVSWDVLEATLVAYVLSGAA